MEYYDDDSRGEIDELTILFKTLQILGSQDSIENNHGDHPDGKKR